MLYKTKEEAQKAAEACVEAMGDPQWKIEVGNNGAQWWWQLVKGKKLAYLGHANNDTADIYTCVIVNDNVGWSVEADSTIPSRAFHTAMRKLFKLGASIWRVTYQLDEKE